MDLERMSDEDRTQLLLDVFRWIQGRNGFLPPEVYWERLKTFPTVYHESLNLAPSDDGNGWEILMDLRPPDDPYYANKYGTQGGTVMMRQTTKELFDRHEAKESLIPVKEWRNEFLYCGTAVTPYTERDHAYVIVFARLLPSKPDKFEGTWVPVDKIDEYPLLSSNKVYVEMAIDVMLRGTLPHYREFRWTD